MKTILNAAILIAMLAAPVAVIYSIHLAFRPGEMIGLVLVGVAVAITGLRKLAQRP